MFEAATLLETTANMIFVYDWGSWCFLDRWTCIYFRFVHPRARRPNRLRERCCTRVQVQDVQLWPTARITPCYRAILQRIAVSCQSWWKAMEVVFYFNF